MRHAFESGYGQSPFRELCEEYPDAMIYPAADFRVEWGPVFHRGRLDGTARVLVIGQDPAQHEVLARAILVGEAGQRLQGFLHKLGVTRSYVMVNTFLYSVYGQGGGARHARDPAISAYRNRWLDALLIDSRVEVVVALGQLADGAWAQWKATRPEVAARLAYARVTHPTWPESSSRGDRAKYAAAVETMLGNWNEGLGILSAALAHPDVPGPVVPYGAAFGPDDKGTIPEEDLFAGAPEWMRSDQSWAVRTGATPEEKRYTIAVTVPESLRPSLQPEALVADRTAKAPPGRFALTGRVVTMDGKGTVLRKGAIYVSDGNIAAVQREEEPPPPGFEQVRPVATHGTIYPGLIELHNHLSYDALRPWDVPKRYGDRDQWGRIPEYQRLISGPMKVLGASPDYLPAIVRYVEAKCLAAGVTTSQGIELFSNFGARRYYRGVVRNVEQTADPELPEAGTKIADVDARDADAFLARLAQRHCFLLHLSEGTDDSAYAHFRALQIEGDRWAVSSSLCGIHCVALQRADFAVLAKRGASMVWSPLSNLLLYGQTAQVAVARREGVRIGLGSDWSPTGSKNLLGELKVARAVSEHEGLKLDDEALVAMVTRDAAEILGWSKVLGSLEAGKRADLVVIDREGGPEYGTLLEANEGTVSLGVVDGTPRYGDAALMAALPEKGATSESWKVGGVKKTFRFGDAEADPAVAGISLGEAQERAKYGLGHLHLLERRAIATLRESFTASLLEPAAAPRWFLALDELDATGRELRPRLPWKGRPTGPGLGLALDTAGAALPPQALDALTVVDDPDYLSRIGRQRNVPPYLGRELTKLY